MCIDDKQILPKFPDFCTKFAKALKFSHPFFQHLYKEGHLGRILGTGPKAATYKQLPTRPERPQGSVAIH